MWTITIPHNCSTFYSWSIFRVECTFSCFSVFVEQIPLRRPRCTDVCSLTRNWWDKSLSDRSIRCQCIVPTVECHRRPIAEISCCPKPWLTAMRCCYPSIISTISLLLNGYNQWRPALWIYLQISALCIRWSFVIAGNPSILSVSQFRVIYTGWSLSYINLYI